MDIKEEFLKFIREQNFLVEEVIDFTLIDFDGEYDGVPVSIGSHYIVNCKANNLLYSSSGVVEFNVIEKTCLIDSLVFNKWLKDEKAIIWVENKKPFFVGRKWNKLLYPKHAPNINLEK